MFRLYLDGKTVQSILKDVHLQLDGLLIKQEIKVYGLRIDEVSIFIDLMNHTSTRCNFLARSVDKKIIGNV